MPNKRYETKEVEAERSKRYRKENKEMILEKNRNYRAKIKKIIYDFYGNKCNCCGESNPFFLQVDHVNNDGCKTKYPVKGKSGIGKRLASMDTYLQIMREGFPDRFQILCANCNWGKRMNKGICPHLNQPLDTLEEV